MTEADTYVIALTMLPAGGGRQSIAGKKLPAGKRSLSRCPARPIFVLCTVSVVREPLARPLH
ncbi:hypothetical protein WME75_18010 [Sorangium sp. So ce1014]|uniref:hypothetical protein n=1 Tax=Sorangium sp. So ce1014 TaxID=3133326 RepID=UPI003F607EA2